MAYSISTYLHGEVQTWYTCAAIYEYVNETHVGDLIAETEEKFHTPGDGWVWVTFNFTAGSRPSLTADTEYLLVVWSEDRSGYTQSLACKNTGEDTHWSKSEPYDGDGRGPLHTSGGWPDPMGGVTSNPRLPGIYCTGRRWLALLRRLPVNSGLKAMTELQ